MNAGASAASFGSLSHFVRALWGLELGVAVLPNSQATAPARPRFDASHVWLPAAAVPQTAGSFSDYQLAAAAHAAAHLQFGAGRFAAKKLKPAQIAIISLLEDARVEQLARAKYPGLARLWSRYHVAQPGIAKTSMALLARLARALDDPNYVDDDAWVTKGQQLFWEGRAEWHDAELCRRIGSVLGNDLGQMRVQFDARNYRVEPPYRDDNAGIWQFDEDDRESPESLESEGARPVDGDPPAREGDAPLPQPREQQRPPTTASDVAAAQTKDPNAEESLRYYGEWDYVIARERPRFCSVRETLADAGDPASVDAALEPYAPLQRRLEHSIQQLAETRPIHVRRLLDGDRFDLPALVAVRAARDRVGPHDARVYRRLRFPRGAPALLLLLDLSESLNAIPPGSEHSALALARTASALLARSLARIAPDFAIHGFSSNGRHDVGYCRLKEFGHTYDTRAKAALAGMRAGRSTRLGAALRHAGTLLGQRRAARKLILVVTDGEPSDVDVHDERYLVLDAKQANAANRARGIASFCVGLDPKAEPQIQRIFGAHHYLLLEKLEALPQQLSRLYLKLSA